MRWTGEKHPAAVVVKALDEGGVRQRGAAGKPPAAFEWTLGEEAMSALVDLIPNEPGTDRDTWLDVMYGVKGNGFDFEIFEKWASRWDGYNPADTLRLWETTNSSTIRSRGGKLRAHAEAANPDGFADWRQRWEAPAVFDDVDDMGLLSPGAPLGVEAAVEALQLAVAQSIVRKQGEMLRFNVNSRMWHRFDGAIWKESPFKLGFRAAMAWAEGALPQLSKASRAAVSKAGFCDGVEKLLQEQPSIAVTSSAFDQDDWLLGTPLGTVELRTGRLRGARAEDMIALSCSVGPAADEDCPRWKRFISWMCTDKAGAVDLEMVRFLKQWAGYCLTGDVSKEMLVFLHGEGANGKGTFIETLQFVMGSYFYLATKDLFMETKHGPHTEELAALARVRMVAADEVPVTSSWNEGLLKGVSGGGTMTGRHLYGKTFTFRIRFKVTISGNDKPTFQGRINEALRRRLHMVECLQVANPKSDTLKAELRAEGDGILRWALNGLADMLASPGAGLFIPGCVRTATDDYFNESDIFGAWLKARVISAPGADTPASDVFSNWLDFRNREGNHTLFGRESLFKAEMEKRGILWGKTKKCNVYKGIKVEVF